MPRRTWLIVARYSSTYCLRAGGPRPILAHAGLQSVATRLSAAHRRCRPAASASPGPARCSRAKLKPVGGAGGQRLLVEVGDRVDQPAGGPHDRHRAVLEAVQLVQPAGLEAAGHDEDVGAGLDPVGQRDSENSSRVATFCGNRSASIVELLLILRLARAQESPIARRAIAPSRASPRPTGRCPFCSVSRPMKATSGVLGDTGRPSSVCSAALQAGFALANRLGGRSWPAGADRSPDSTRGSRRR